MFTDHTRAIRFLRTSIEAAGVPICEVHAGDRLRGGEGCSIEILHPPPGGLVATHNANSVVALVSYRGQSLLLPGDLDTPGLDDLLDEDPRRCQVLLAPHHGSRRSQPSGLVGWCRPETVVISGARDNDFNEVVDTYRRLAPHCLHTAQSGAIQIRINPAGLSLVTFCQQ